MPKLGFKSIHISFPNTFPKNSQ